MSTVSLVDLRYESRHGMPVYVIYVESDPGPGFRTNNTSVHMFPSKFGVREFVRKKHPMLYEQLNSQLDSMPGKV